MSNYPTLTVDGDCDVTHWTSRPIIRIDDGDLPAVWNVGTPYTPGPPHGRPLRVGDTVTLATEWEDGDRVPFATATVAKITKHYDPLNDSFIHDVTVENVEAL